MDSIRSSLWHFGFPLKRRIWRFFYLMGHRTRNENNSRSRTEPGRNGWKSDEGEWHCFLSVRKGYRYGAFRRRQLSCLVWNSFHTLLHSVGSWICKIINGCSSSGKDAHWSVIRLGSCLVWMCEKTSVPERCLQSEHCFIFGPANQGWPCEPVRWSDISQERRVEATPKCLISSTTHWNNMIITCN